MRIVGTKVVDGVAVPDIPAGEPFPPPNALLVQASATQYLVYEVGDEDHVPENSRPELQALVDSDCTDDLVLWRYVDLQKLYMLLLHGELHFTPAARLRQDEGYELRIPLARLASAEAQIKASLEEKFPGDPRNAAYAEALMPKDLSDLEGYAISCWHINSSENNAFWSAYVPNGGVAIKTTLGRIKRAYAARWRENLRAQRHVMAARVVYINYEADDFQPIPLSAGVENVFHKSHFFAFEKEFRLALALQRGDPAHQAAHCRVPIEVSVLIEEIVVGPRPKHMVEFIVKDMVQRAGLDSALVRPSLVGPDGAARLFTQPK